MSLSHYFAYQYLLFWNVFWTLLPVLGIGVFDKDLEPRTLMAIPDVYRFGRLGLWFGMPRFIWYMFEGIVQSVVCYFIILYTYTFTTARHDGYNVGLYEFRYVFSLFSLLLRIDN
jgi:phospholipid-translocating ATPase